MTDPLSNNISNWLWFYFLLILELRKLQDYQYLNEFLQKYKTFPTWFLIAVLNAPR